VFRDLETSEINVVYKRNAGGIGLIQPQAWCCRTVCTVLQYYYSTSSTYTTRMEKVHVYVV
jgi:hypothetical protein